jgi:hypothetical protein
MKMGVNVGSDRVRFPAPVKVGARHPRPGRDPQGRGAGRSGAIHRPRQHRDRGQRPPRLRHRHHQPLHLPPRRQGIHRKPASMTEAVIVSTARTALSKSFRGSFNDTEAPVLGGHVVRAVVERAGIEPGAVEDVIMGAAVQQGTQAYNIGRLCAYTGGLPDSVPGMALDRMCASGLMSIGVAAKSILAGEREDRRGRRRRIPLAHPDQAQEHLPRPVAGRAGGGAHGLHPHDGDRRDRRPPLRHQPLGPGRLRPAEPAAHR